MTVGIVVVAMMVIGTTGCRFHFDSAPATDASSDTPSLDAPIDPDGPAGSVIESFGETPGATHSNVTSDTFLDGEAGSQTDNFGGSGSLSIEGSQKRALLLFDVSAIPPGKVIVSARLHVEGNAENAGAMVSIAPILESWTEGSLSGLAGVANFTQRTATQNWTTAGAGSPGSAGASIATFSVPVTSAIVSVDLPVATVQSWVDTPSANFGVVLSASGGGDVHLSSSDDGTATARPELVVTYFP